MKVAPLQIGDCFFTEVSVSANPDGKEADLNQIVCNVLPEHFLRDKQNPREWCIILRTAIVAKEGSAPPYVGKVEVFGTFSVDKSWPADKIEQLVYINGSGILYSVVREMICNITARGVWKMLLLPSLSFMEMYKDVLSARAAEDAKKATAGEIQSAAVGQAPAPLTSPPAPPSTTKAA